MEFRVSIWSFFSGQFGLDVLALLASFVRIYWPSGPVWFWCTGPTGSLVRTYWPFGPVWFWCTGPSGQFGPDVLALRASLVLTYWPFGPVWSGYTAPSSQSGSDVLAIRASLVLTYWPFGPVLSGCTCPPGQSGSDVLALWASLVLTYWSLRTSLVVMSWPFGPSYSSYTGPVWSYLDLFFIVDLLWPLVDVTLWCQKWLRSIPRATSFNLVDALPYLGYFQFLTFGDPWWPLGWPWVMLKMVAFDSPWNFLPFGRSSDICWKFSIFDLR